jgi:cytochrome c-type biogenesis protein CcmH
LDDSLAMDPSRKLSSAAEVVVEARLSRSGEALRRPGDLYGVSVPIRPGTGGVRLIIDQVVAP